MFYHGLELLIVTNSRFRGVQRYVEIILHKVTEPLNVLHQLCEYDCGSTKTSKTFSKDQIYRELVYEGDAFVLDEVIVELDKFA